MTNDRWREFLSVLIAGALTRVPMSNLVNECTFYHLFDDVVWVKFN